MHADEVSLARDIVNLETDIKERKQKIVKLQAKVDSLRADTLRLGKRVAMWSDSVAHWEKKNNGITKSLEQMKAEGKVLQNSKKPLLRTKRQELKDLLIKKRAELKKSIEGTANYKIYAIEYAENYIIGKPYYTMAEDSLRMFDESLRLFSGDAEADAVRAKVVELLDDLTEKDSFATLRKWIAINDRSEVNDNLYNYCSYLQTLIGEINKKRKRINNKNLLIKECNTFMNEPSNKQFIKEGIYPKPYMSKLSKRYFDALAADPFSEEVKAIEKEILSIKLPD